MRAALYTARPQPEVAIPWDDVAPVRGMDGTVPIHNMPPGTAVFLYNLYPAEYGCVTRPGTADWAQNLAGLDGVRTLIPFLGQLGDFSQLRLFAATTTGIYDVTSQGTDNPTPVQPFAVQTGNAGRCIALHFTDPNGNQQLLVADGANGLYEYNPVGSVWTKYTNQITWPDSTTANDIDFIMTHKGRVWFIARDKADAYYLPVGSKNGQATKFQFGSKMQHGGYLVGLWNWSVDGGNGLDDYLVGVGKGGDAIIYQGTDPASASTWSMVGTWYIGSPPAGRKVAVEVGSDLLLLSSVGVTSTSALMSGIDPTRVERNVTGKIARLVRDAVTSKSNLYGWELSLLPEEGLLALNTPKNVNERHIQFMLNLNKVSEDSGGGWGMWRDVPATGFASFGGEIFCGTADGRVLQLRGSLDGVDINGAGGTPVDFSGLMRFTHFDAPALYKQIQFIRPTFITGNVIALSSKAVYDYNLNEQNLIPAARERGGALWDVAKWDNALWSGTFSESVLSGGSGYGTEAGIYIQGNTVARATLANIEGTYTRWKFL